MSADVLAAIAADIAGLTKLVPLPPEELGYGRDLSCVADLTVDLAEVSPLTPRGIGESTIRRLTTPRGSLPDDPNYGLDLRAYCNRGVPVDELRDIAGRVSMEIVKDDRIQSARVVVTQPEPRALRVEIQITPAVIGLAPFSLTFVLTSGAVAVEAIR